MPTLPNPKQIQDWVNSTVQTSTNLAKQQTVALCKAYPLGNEPKTLISV
jgi:hypothetical protein